MAISTETFKINAGWAKSDLITQMEQAIYPSWMECSRLLDILLV